MPVGALWEPLAYPKVLVKEYLEQSEQQEQNFSKIRNYTEELHF
jgi:hypothetical protein